MAMKLVKKTADYSIYQRGDDRYAVRDADKKPINGDEKVRILVAEELIKAALPAEPAPEAEESAEETEVEAAAEEALEAEEVTEEEAPAEEAAAGDETPAEEADAEDEEDK